MKIGIIGSGGREHALCWALHKSKKIKQIFCFPGNAGTSNIASNINIKLDNFNKIKKFIQKNKINLVIVGPEKPLVDGIVDYLEKNKIKVFGPNKKASQLEGSKIFTKELCRKYNIPTARFEIFKDKKTSKKFLLNCNYPIVIKADGLASGKGVYICKDKSESFVAIDEIFNGKFGIAKKVLLEEFLDGEEMSYFIISDGNSIKSFNTAQDHKRVLEKDRGKNTGGMGAYSPSKLINNDLEKKILDKIIKPTINGLKKLGTNYRGFLYAGLMIKHNEPYLIEYNVRMGDPECQTIIPRLKNDLLDIVLACCNKTLKKIDIKWNLKKSLCIVLCSKGYPEKFKKDVEIKNLNKVKQTNNDFYFHAGTSYMNQKIYAIGGRVLNFVSLSKNFKDARKKVIKNLKILNWNKGFYRKDIGYKVIDQ
jgi:phosphoribosylamine---glycine ligase